MNRPKTFEIMLAQQMLGGLVHFFQIELTFYLPGIGRIKRANHFFIRDSVQVTLPDAVMFVKSRWHLFSTHHPDLSAT